jgi:hypothetical protein
LNSVRPAPRPWILAAGLALLAAAGSLLRFTPTFVLWRGLDLPAAAVDPALNRAGEALRQLQHPFSYQATPNNRVIEWRLLFPVLGHALHLSPAAYLALPGLGCLLVLTLIAALLLRHGFTALQALAATLTAATCSWFFVSTAWLAYFDSWYVLGLLVTVFAPRGALVAAALATPWIDERYVLTLPLCLVLRHCYADSAGLAAPGRARWRDAAWAGLALVPWLLIRLGAVALHRDPVTGGYLQAMTPTANGPFYAVGLWEGLRWAWIAPLTWLAVETRAKRPRSLLVTGVLVVTVGLNLVAANDLSRSVSIALPAVVLALLLLRQLRPGQFGVLLFAVCGLNLLFPAEHVVSNWTEPINAFPVELDHARHPPPVLDPDYYVHAAVVYNEQGNPQAALGLLDAAVSLDRRDAAAWANRAVAHYKLRRLAEARADADEAVRLEPRLTEALYNRGMVRAAQGDMAGALDDVGAALRTAPADWPARPQAEAEAALLRAKMTER